MPVSLTEPWSKKHKAVTKHGSMPFNLSNSFAQPTTHPELVAWTKARGDDALLEEFATHDLGYTASGGSRDLREAIADLYGERIGADNVVVFAGAQAAVAAAALALVGAGDHAIVFTPGYQSVLEAPVHAGGSVTRVPLSAANDWAVDAAAFEAAMTPRTKYAVLNQPYNPAGRVMAPAQFSALIAVAERRGVYVLCDEVYRLLEHDGTARLPAMADAYARGLSAVTLSKPWGAGGCSVGWLAFPDASLRQRLLDVQYFGTACIGRATELQALMVLRASDAILARNLAIIQTNLGKVDAFLAKHADLFCWSARPNAGAIGSVRFKGPLSTLELGDALAAAGISVKPAYCFTDEPITDANDYFRIGFGEAKMPAALAALDAFVDANRAAWAAAAAAP